MNCQNSVLKKLEWHVLFFANFKSLGKSGLWIAVTSYHATALSFTPALTSSGPIAFAAFNFGLANLSGNAGFGCSLYCYLRFIILLTCFNRCIDFVFLVVDKLNTRSSYFCVPFFLWCSTCSLTVLMHWHDSELI